MGLGRGNGKDHAIQEVVSPEAWVWFCGSRPQLTTHKQKPHEEVQDGEETVSQDGPLQHSGPIRPKQTCRTA